MKNYDKAYQEYKSISGLSSKDMNTWIKINPFVALRIENQAIEFLNKSKEL